MIEKLKKYFGILFLFLTFLSGIALAEAACSIGANPLSMDARAIPEQTVIATWNLYNIHGDRTTHVKLSTIEAPTDWKISFEPELHKATYSVMGVAQTIEENVALELTPIVKTKPETIPEGMDYVKHPKQEGYIPVKVIKIYIDVPKDAKLWKEYNLAFTATGNCFTEPGAVVAAVATQLELKVKTISGEFTEVPLEEVPEEEKEEVEKAPLLGAVVTEVPKVTKVALKEILIIITILAALVIVFSFFVLRKGKKI